MLPFSTIGRFFLGVPMLAFGLQHLVYGGFVTRVVPKLPEWVPGQTFLAYAVGVGMVAAGLAIITGKKARPAAELLGAFLLLSALLLHLPIAAAQPYAGGLWTNTGKALALAGGAFILAGALPVSRSLSAFESLGAVVALDRFIPLGRYFFSAFLILGGVQHFIYPQFCATLVPAWIGGGIFWTYFAGVALIAAGTGIVGTACPRLAAALAGAMIFAWVLVLHLPRALADLHNSNETTAVFEAIAMSGIAFLLAAPRTKNASAAARPAAAIDGSGADQRQ